MLKKCKKQIRLKSYYKKLRGDLQKLNIKLEYENKIKKKTITARYTFSKKFSRL